MNYPRFFARAAGETRRVFIALFILSFPLLCVIKLLDDAFGLVGVVGGFLAPLMGLVGLPGESALVFATGIFLNNYAAGLVLISLWETLDLTTAQITVLLTMILVAHALPVEGRIAHKAGLRLTAATALRFGGALVLGAMLNWLYGDRFLRGKPAAPLSSGAADARWGEWLVSQGHNWLVVLGIIFVLIVVINMMRAMRIERMMIKRMAPVFGLIGIHKKTGTMTMVGLLMGLSFGGGLLIERARAGDIDRRELLCVLAALCLCHSIIEDSLLMMLLGAHWTGVLAARVVFSFAVVFIFAAYIYRADERVVDLLSPYKRREA